MLWLKKKFFTELLLMCPICLTSKLMLWTLERYFGNVPSYRNLSKIKVGRLQLRSEKKNALLSILSI